MNSEHNMPNVYWLKLSKVMKGTNNYVLSDSY